MRKVLTLIIEFIRARVFVQGLYRIVGCCVDCHQSPAPRTTAEPISQKRVARNVRHRRWPVFPKCGGRLRVVAD